MHAQINLKKDAIQCLNAGKTVEVADTMPRFEDAQVTCLKRAMLTKAKSGFLLDPVEIEQIVRESGLNREQILMWGENFRMRYKTEQERLSFLQADPREKQVT